MAILTALGSLVTGGSAAAARVDVCGTIAANTTWTAGNVYVITCSSAVAAGATLTIQPGTIIKVSSGSLSVDGAVIAAGTAASPIDFTSYRDDSVGGDTNGDGSATSPAKGDWCSVTFNAGSSGRLSNATLTWGGSSGCFATQSALVRSYTSQLTLDHVTLQHSGYHGLWASKASVAVANSTITGNHWYGLYYAGLDPAVPLSVTGNVFTATGDGAGFLAFDGTPFAGATLAGNRSSDGRCGFAMGGTADGDVTWDNGDDLPIVVYNQTLTVAAGRTLTLSPGSVVKSYAGVLAVDGALVAQGSADRPIVFTSYRDDSAAGDTNADAAATVAASTDWCGVTFKAASSGRLAHARLNWGGSYGCYYTQSALVRSFTNDLLLERVTLTHAHHNGLWTSGASVAARNGSIAGNAIGVTNGTPSTSLIDARFNWWGDASGPRHPTMNPNGKGNPVSDGVLFFPWATDAAGTLPDDVLVNVAGPTGVSPGAGAEYAVSCYTARAIAGAVLVLALPGAVEYGDSTGGGEYWPGRHQVLWRLGDLAAGDERTFGTRVRYRWGTPSGTVEAFTAMLLPEIGTELDPAPYLDFTPSAVAAATPMTAGEVAGERQLHGEVEALVQRGLARGLTLLGGARLALTGGATATRLYLADRRQALFVDLQGAEVSAVQMGGGTFDFGDAARGITLDLETFADELWGTWSETEAAASGAAATQTPRLSHKQCFRNCIFKAAGAELIGIVVQPVNLALASPNCAEALKGDRENFEDCFLSVQDAFEGAGIFGAMRGCIRDCSDPGKRALHVCTGPMTYCDPTRGAKYYTTWACSSIGTWVDVPRVLRCASPGDVCVPGWLDEDGTPCKYCEDRLLEGLAAAGGAQALCLQAKKKGGDCQATTIRVAKDPNAKLGPVGDVLPGQQLGYTIQCENEGAGQAYEVYIEDELSPYLDESTLSASGNFRYLPASRTVFWRIGELAPKGQPGSKGEVSLSVRARGGLPGGTVIANQAVVYFPSVPETTPTNAVVNVVQPVVAHPQEVETPYAQPVAITLSGADVSATPLAFAISEQPLYGALSGTPPLVTYTPAESFTGQDRFAFTVSNGTSTSRPADLLIDVTPTAADSTPPAILWTYPADGAVSRTATGPITEGDGSPVYPPRLVAQLSEPLSAATVGAATVAVSDAGGRTVDAAVGFDATSNQITVKAREPWRTGRYTVTLGVGLRDLAGNPLAAPFTWHIEVRPTLPFRRRLYSVP